MGTTTDLPPLLPRYRHAFSVADVLDDTIQVFRHVWLRMIGLNLLILVMGLLLLGVVAGAFLLAGGSALITFFADIVRLGVAASEAARAGRPAPPVGPIGPPNVPGAALAVAATFGLGVMIVGPLLSMTWYGATSLMTDRIVRGERLGVGQAFVGGLRRAPALYGAGFLYVIGVALAAAIAFAIVYALRAWTALAALVAAIALVMWAVNQNARQAWLKWLIVVATPFGLPFYCTIAWSLFIPAGAVERAGPLRALQRSAELVSGQWFRILAMWLVMSIIVSLLQAIPGAMVGALFAGAGGVNLTTPQGIDLAANVAQFAGGYVGGVLFGALPMSAATLAFVALRNQREGTDLAERLAALELPVAPRGPQALGAPGSPPTFP